MGRRFRLCARFGVELPRPPDPVGRRPAHHGRVPFEQDRLRLAALGVFVLLHVCVAGRRLVSRPPRPRNRDRMGRGVVVVGCRSLRLDQKSRPADRRACFPGHLGIRGRSRGGQGERDLPRTKKSRHRSRHDAGRIEHRQHRRSVARRRDDRLAKSVLSSARRSVSPGFPSGSRCAAKSALTKKCRRSASRARSGVFWETGGCWC